MFQKKEKGEKNNVHTNFKHMHLSLCGLANNFALTGALADSIRNRTDIHFGVYHSLFEFYNPLYLQDVANNYTTQNYVRVRSYSNIKVKLERKTV